MLVADRYLLRAPLGHGGMGDVWRAEHVGLGREVAVKLLRDAEAAPAELHARFRREASVAASIDHPNVVRVLDYGVDRERGPVLVMELLVGRTLDDALAGGDAVGLGAALTWLEPIAAALDVIHAHGLVHRDVKPANIVEAVDASGQRTVKLVDFGLVAFTDGRERITRRGMIVGTPHYMAPEALEGDAPAPSQDVYALATIAFELISGALPFEEDSVPALLAAKLGMRARSLAESTGRLFGLRLEETFDAALDPEPAKRPATAGALLERLRACTRRR